MRKLLILTSFIAINAMAFFPDIDVKSISGRYIDGKGSAFAHSAIYDLDVVKISHENIDVKFNIVSKNLVLNDKNTTVKLKYDFSFLNFLKAATFESLNIESKSKKFEVSAPEVNIFVDEDQIEFIEMGILSDLEGATINTDGDIDIFSGVLINGQIDIKKARMLSYDLTDLYNDIVVEYPELNEDKSLQKTAKIPLIVRNLRLNLKESSFSGRALLDSWINAWVYVGGKIENDTKSKKVKITLTKAKLGVFSIRKILLRKLRKAGINGVTVRGNVITVDLAVALN